MTATNPRQALLIPCSPAPEAPEVTRRKKQFAYRKAWCKANPEKQRQYQRTYLESLKMKAAAAAVIPAQPAPVEVTLSELAQQVADLKAVVLQLVIDKQQSIAIRGSGLVITKPPAAPQRVSSR
jgi:hypothetical protein